MRSGRWLILILILTSGAMYGQEKISFPLITNGGQWPDKVMASSELGSGKFFLERNGFTYNFYDLTAIREAHNEGKIFQPSDVRIRGHVYQVTFEGCDPQAKTTFDDKQKTFYNYFLGNDEQKWAGGCASYSKIKRQDFYQGIDLLVYSSDFFLKYDFIVRPGSDVTNIQMQFNGVEKLQLENGRIKVTTSVNEVWEQKPIAWQMIHGEKKLVECNYVLNKNVVSFQFPKGYDPSTELIIDPEIVFSTYSGSFSDNFGYTATYDEDGFLYSGSSAFGQNYPVTIGAYQVTHHGGDSTIEEGIDMALSKYDVSGTYMVWSTFMGGNGDDLPHSIITNSEHELFVYGSTGSEDYPTTSSAIQSNFQGGSLVSPSGTGAVFPNGTDIVVTHFNADCTDLIGSTYLGGTGNDGVNTATSLKKNYADEFRGEISLDENENVLVVSSTFSNNFPLTNALQNTIGGAQDAVVLKLDPTLDLMLWGTYLGGIGDDSGFSISNNSIGQLYLCGGTTSTDFPATSGCAQPTYGGGTSDAYVVQLSSNGQSILASTFWGTDEYDQFYFIEVDSDDLVYAFGQTNADSTDLIINAGYGTPNSGNLLTKFNASLNQVIWSTVFGTGNAKPNLSPSAFLVDYCNRVYISGWGITTVNNNPLNPGANLYSMNNLSTTSDAFDSTCSTGDFYMAVFDENMTQLEYATFFGGGSSSEHVDGGTSRFDRKGVIYQSVCAGCGSFDDFPIFPSNAWSSVNNSSCNNGVFKFDFQLPLTIADFTVPPIFCANAPITMNNSSTYAQTFEWNFGDASGTSNLAEPTHSYSDPGTYTIRLVVTHNGTCNGVDTLYKEIEIIEPLTGDLDDIALCEGQQTTIGPDSNSPSFEYLWTPNVYLSDNTVPNPTFIDGSTTNYTLHVTHDGCQDTYFQTIEVTELDLVIPGDTILCDENVFYALAEYSPSDAAITWSDASNFSNVINDNAADADINVDVAIPTTFYVKLEKNGCVVTDHLFVNLVSFQTVIEGDFTTCVDDTVTLHVLDPNANFTYSWLPTDLILTGQNTPQVEVIVPAETTYTIQSNTNTGCVANDSVTVTVSYLTDEILVATATPTIILQGQSAALNAEPSGYNYQWSPPTWLNNPNIENPIASPLETTTYTVTVSDGECIASARVLIEVVDFVCGPPNIYVPNAFTPNKDLRNEKLFVRANNISSLYFVIYDRWGEKIFETKKLEAGWDGSFEGREVDPDVYVYYLEATCIGGQEYFEEGNITVIR